MTLPMKPAAHHPLGPSAWPAWSVCADYEPTEDPDDVDPREDDETPPDDTPAARGQVQHEAAALKLTGKPVEPVWKHLTPTEREEVEWAVERVLSLVEEHGYAVEDIKVERRVSLLVEDSMQIRYFGTLDVSFGNILIDLKFGMIRNYFCQLVGYALPMFAEIDASFIDAYALFARYRRGTRYHLDRETAERVGYGILARRESVFRTPVPCEYCGWCAKKLNCPAINALNNQVIAQRDEIPDALVLGSARNKELMSDPLLAGKALYLWRAFLKKWGEGVDYGTSMMAEGGVLPVGFAKIHRSGRRSVSDGGKAVAAMIAKGIPEESLKGVLSCSLGSLVAAYHSAMGGTKKEAERKVESILQENELLVRGEDGFSLRAMTGIQDILAAASAKEIKQ